MLKGTFSIMMLNDCHFNPQDKEMSVFSIPFCHLPHPGDKLVMAKSDERKGTGSTPGRGKGGRKWELCSLEQEQRLRQGAGRWGEDKTQRRHESRGFNLSGSISKRDKGPATSLDPAKESHS